MAHCWSTRRPAPPWCRAATSSYLSRPMLLAFDIGNTETTVGLFAGDRLAGHWRLHSTPPRTPHEWSSVFSPPLTPARPPPQENPAAIVAPVGPPGTPRPCEGIP